MSSESKQARAEARIGQSLRSYFNLATAKHSPLRSIARDLDVSLITAKVWTYQFNPHNYRLDFGATITALYVLVLAGVIVGGFLTYYWINPY